MITAEQEWRQLWLAVPVVPAKTYKVIERQGQASVIHSFPSLTDALTYVVIHARVNPMHAEELRRTLLSGQEWVSRRRRRWRLTTETKR